jgi:hypothetical protein
MKKLVGFAICLAFLVWGASAVHADHHEAGEAAAAADAAEQAWDQAKVTELASTLADQAKKVRDAQRRAPTPNVASGYSRAHMRFTDDLRLITNEAKHLNKQLKQGGDRQATQPVYDRLAVLVANDREDAERMMIVEQVATQIEAARATMNGLRGYYGDPPVEEPISNMPR